MSNTATSARIRALILIGACVALLGFAGCGGGDDSSSTPTTSEPATGATGAGGSDVAASVEQQFKDGLAASGYDQDQIDCIVEGLNGDEFTAEDGQAILDAGGDSSNLPSDLTDKIQAVVAGC